MQTDHKCSSNALNNVKNRLFKFGIKEKNYCKAVVVGENGKPKDASMQKKVISVAQMIAGGAITLAGVPLVGVPFVGSGVILTGAGIALDGQRKLTGREPTRMEYAIDRAGSALSKSAKDAMRKNADWGAKRARNLTQKVGDRMPNGVMRAGSTTKKAMLSAGESIPAHISSAAKTAKEVGGVVAQEGPVAIAGVAAGVGAFVGMGAGLVYAGKKVIGKKR